MRRPALKTPPCVLALATEQLARFRGVAGVGHLRVGAAVVSSQISWWQTGGAPLTRQ